MFSIMMEIRRYIKTLGFSEKDILYSRYKMLNKYDKNVVMKIINALINKED